MLQPLAQCLCGIGVSLPYTSQNKRPRVEALLQYSSPLRLTLARADFIRNLNFKAPEANITLMSVFTLYWLPTHVS